MLISKTGVEIISASDAYNEAKQILIDAFGDKVEVPAGSPMDYFCQSLANAFVKRDADVQAVLTQVDPRTAENMFLDALGSLTLSPRVDATYTTVKAQCRGAPNTKISKNSKAISKNGDIFLSVADAVIEDTGMIEVEFKASVSGPIPMPQHYLTEIYTQIKGWDSIDNAAAGVDGEAVQDDVNYRILRMNTIKRASSGQTPSILANTLLVSGVRNAVILDNSTGSTVEKSGISMLPHSIWLCVIGGVDKDIAQVLYERKSGGAEMLGNVIVDVPIDDTPAKFTAKFNRPNNLNTTVDIALDKNYEYPPETEDLIKKTIADNFVYGKSIRMGREIFASMITNWLMQINIPNVRAVYFNKSQLSITPKINEMAVISAINFSYA